MANPTVKTDRPSTAPLDHLCTTHSGSRLPPPGCPTLNCDEHLPPEMVFSTTMSVKARLGFGLVAALPLLAPYDLLVKPDWTGTPYLALLFAIAVSLGAVAVSLLLLLVAIFGIDRRVEFNPISKTVHVSESHLLQGKRDFDYSFAEIAQLELVCQDWSDGPSTYEIRLTPNAGKPFSFGGVSSRESAESILTSLRTIVGRTL